MRRARGAVEATNPAGRVPFTLWPASVGTTRLYLSPDSGSAPPFTGQACHEIAHAAGGPGREFLDTDRESYATNNARREIAEEAAAAMAGAQRGFSGEISLHL